ncbi:hypothetical protein Bca4012_020222 [Brassica carinata]
MRMIDGFGLDGTDPSTRDDQLAILPTIAETSTPVDAGRKSPRDGDLEDQPGELNAAVGDLPGTPVTKKKKQSKRKGSAEEKTASDARNVPQLRDDADSDLPPGRDPGQDTGVTLQGALKTGQEDVPSATLLKKRRKKKMKKKMEVDPMAEAQTLKEADPGISEPKASFPVDSLIFRPSYLDVVRQRREADDCVDALVAKYDSELKVSYVSLGKAQEEADKGKSALRDEAPAGVSTHGSNVGLVDTGAVADLQASEHRSVSEGHKKDSTAVLSDNMEEDEVSDFDSDDGRGRPESDKTRPMGEDTKLQISSTGASRPSPGQEEARGADLAAPKE